jgi:phenylacetate-CoA ligase
MFKISSLPNQLSPNYAVILISAWCLENIYAIFRRDRRLYCLLHLHFLQSFLLKVGQIRAQRVYLQARDRCPAYAALIASQGKSVQKSRQWRLDRLPIMTKENFVKQYSLEQRCYDGKIPLDGTIIDESSGSSGMPNNWVRSQAERNDLNRSIQLVYQLSHADRYPADRSILLNCFALGAWATGMNISMALADVSILKSIGCDRQKLENTLRQFGSSYRYLIFGYPPFIKSFLDNTTLDLSQYRLNLVVGGESISESLRSYLLQYFETVISSYGASDLEINLGQETDLTIELRRRCQSNPELSQHLFGRAIPPAIFQYNPIEHVIETLPNGELLFTVVRLNGAAPKIRYNLRDVGGTMSYAELAGKLRLAGIEIGQLIQRQSHLPILFMYGRSDLTISFYGANIYPAEIAEIVQNHPILCQQINSFQLSCYDDRQINRRLKITLELTTEKIPNSVSVEWVRDFFWQALSQCNQDFREVTKMFDQTAIEIELQPHGTGLFRDRDSRTKHQYIA